MSTLKPVLVLMDYRGGRRLERALRSIAATEHLFSRVVLSVTAARDSEDMAIVRRYLEAQSARGTPSKAEVLCTQVELPTMAHQRFWVDYLERTGTGPRDWIYWLSYDDEVRPAGIERVLDVNGDWPLVHGTAYFGPWAMRHEKGDEVFDGPWDVDLESWTSFPLDGPTELSVADWIAGQLRQPTYMQMSGSVNTFECFVRLRDSVPRKKGPMRIEMAIASAPCNLRVQEFAEPVVVIYGRPTSDRASYGAAARQEDVHLMVWLAQYGARHPAALPTLARAAGSVAASYGRVITRRGSLAAEQWIVRGTVSP